MDKPRFSLIFSMLILFMALSAIPADAADLSQWTLRNSQLSAVTEGNGIYAAVGKNGFIMRSTDGNHWNSVTSGTDKDLSGIAYGNGVFVAVGGGTALVSSDGRSWQVFTPSAFGAYSIAFGSGTFAAIGGTNVYTSSDGITWSSAISTGAINSLSHIIHGNTKFVAVGYGGTIITAPDTDLTNWTLQNSHVTTTIWQAAYNGTSTYIAVGESGTVVTSDDAVSWTVQTSGVTRTFMAVDYGNGRFVTTGSNSSNDAGHIWTSPNGVGASWMEQTSNAYEWFFDVLYASGKYILVGGKILSSTNGTTWNVVHGGTGWDIWGLTYGNGLYSAGTFAGNVIISPNGRQWTEARPADLRTITGLAYNPTNHRFVATLGNGHLIYSDDGNTWLPHSFVASAGLNGIEYLHNQFIGFGANGKIILSANGDSWSEISTGSSNSFQAAAYGNNIYVVVGSGTTVYSSPDGNIWTPHATPATNDFNGIAYGNGRFIASGYFADVIISANGTDWGLGTNVGVPVYTIRFYDGLFLAMGQTYGYIYTSADGLIWDSVKTPCNMSLFSASVEGPSVLAAGYDGTIIQLNSPSIIIGGGGGGGGGCFIASATDGTKLRILSVLLIILPGLIAVWARRLYNQSRANSKRFLH